MEVRRKAEVLAPVGSWEMCQAAVHNGADAIYMGVPHFNARGRTRDFSIEELKFMIEFCHLYGVRVFLACNVLVFESELKEIESILRTVLPLRPDAFIVQDIGLVRLIKKLAPQQIVHASTQMTITNNEAIEITSDLGIQRYVLGREVSIAEMQRIRTATEKELEVFVHGALCVSYSGQCLTSESHGGRSANRGQCAQSCRLDYQLIVDGEERDLGEKRYLVSPQDLSGLEDIGRLVEIGIDSFKIEGRLKSPEYVASTVRNYREASDRAFAGSEFSDKELKQRSAELGLTFTRGHFNGWFDGVNHQKLVDARFSRPHGNILGEVTAVDNDQIEVLTQESLTIGDGVVFKNFEQNSEVGGIVFSVHAARPGRIKLRLGREFRTSTITVGMEVFHNSSSLLEKKLRLTYQDKAQWKKIPISAVLSGKAGEKLKFELTDDRANSCSVESAVVLQPASSAPLTVQSAGDELGALSATAFVLEDFKFEVEGKVFIHNREIKDLRRRGIEKLTMQRVGTDQCSLESTESVADWRAQVYQSIENQTEKSIKSSPSLQVLIREEAQLAALVGQNIDTVYLDYEFNKDYERSLKEVRELGFRCGIATTRILKPGELGHLKYIERLKPDCILVRNLGALQYYQERQIPLVGDFSLNISNALSAAWFLEKKLIRLCPSYDLNQWQLIDLLTSLSPQFFEVTVHQYMPAFHMEHCVYAAFLSKGTSYRDCGRPCEKHRVELRDRDGIVHPLKPDAECRNTMFQGKPQAALRILPELIVHGVSNFRIEALFETALELRAKVQAYSQVLHQGASPEQVLGSLGIVERYGVTEGQLLNTRVYEDKKKISLAVL